MILSCFDGCGSIFWRFTIPKRGKIRVRVEGNTKSLNNSELRNLLYRAGTVLIKMLYFNQLLCLLQHPVLELTYYRRPLESFNISTGRKTWCPSSLVRSLLTLYLLHVKQRQNSDVYDKFTKHNIHAITPHSLGLCWCSPLYAHDPLRMSTRVLRLKGGGRNGNSACNIETLRRRC